MSCLIHWYLKMMSSISINIWKKLCVIREADLDSNKMGMVNTFIRIEQEESPQPNPIEDGFLEGEQ